jgi:hypothetical protein
MNGEKCSFCGKTLTLNYSFSYGFPGIPQILACNRFLCRKVIQRTRKLRNDVGKYISILGTKIHDFGEK